MVKRQFCVRDCLSLLTIIFALALFFQHGYAQVSQETVSAQPNSYLPSGEGKELLKALCTSCHDLGRVITQRRDIKVWRETVKGMLAGWDPRYSEYLGDDVEVLSRYLAQYFGPLTPAYETLQSNSDLREKYLKGEIKSLININTASLAELTKLPGISKHIAEMIIKHRTTHGFFKRSEDLKTLGQIADEEFEKLKDFITVD